MTDKHENGYCPVCRTETGVFLCRKGFKGQSRDGTTDFWPTEFYHCTGCGRYFSVEAGYFSCWAREDKRLEYETVIGRKPICFECCHSQLEIQRWVGKLKIEKHICWTDKGSVLSIAGEDYCKSKATASLCRISPVIGRHGVPI